MIDRFLPLVERMRSEAEEGLLYSAAQVACYVGGKLSAFSVGTDHYGDPIRDDSLWALYCAVKPVAALAVLRLIDEGELSPDDELRHLLAWQPQWSEAVGRITVEELLTHRSGLPGEDAMTFRLLPPHQRVPALLTGPLGPKACSYSEVSGWLLLGEVVAALTGTAYAVAADELVLGPLDLCDEEIHLQPTEEEFSQIEGRVVVRHDATGDHEVLLLAEETASVHAEVNPGLGGLASMRGLAAFYSRLLEERAGARRCVSPETLDRALAPASTVDRTTGATVGLGLGFMTMLETWGFGNRLSSGAFGHAGHAGSTIGFADPGSGLACAATFDRLIDYESSMSLRRPVLVNAIAKAAT